MRDTRGRGNMGELTAIIHFIASTLSCSHIFPSLFSSREITYDTFAVGGKGAMSEMRKGRDTKELQTYIHSLIGVKTVIRNDAIYVGVSHEYSLVKNRQCINPAS